MRKIKLLKDYKSYKKGLIVIVSNNDAFCLVDELKVATYNIVGRQKVILSEVKKIMKPKKRKGYIIKGM